MLHHDYTPTQASVQSRDASRPLWMALLARAPLPLLETHLAAQCEGNLQWLRPLETGLMMVQGRAGGSGQRFNLGEVRVTRCVLKPDAARTGCQQVGLQPTQGLVYPAHGTGAGQHTPCQSGQETAGSGSSAACEHRQEATGRSCTQENSASRTRRQPGCTG